MTLEANQRKITPKETHEDKGYTDAELRILTDLTNQKIKLVGIPRCDGNKLVLDFVRRRNRFLPSDLTDINQSELDQLMTAIKDTWKKKFLRDQRSRPYQIVHELSYPAGTGYYCRVIINLHRDKVEIISPFKWSAKVEELNFQ